MKKIVFTILILLIAVLAFVSCYNNSITKGRNISSIEVIRQSDNQKWTLSDKDEINKFIKALNNRQKTNAKIDIRPHDYAVQIFFTNKSKKEYRLWVDEDINVRGVLMDESSTWFINKESNPIFKEILQ